MDPHNRPLAQPETLESQLRSMILSNASSDQATQPNTTNHPLMSSIQYPQKVVSPGQPFASNSSVLPQQLNSGSFPTENYKGSFNRYNGRYDYSAQTNRSQGQYFNQRPVHNSSQHTNQASYQHPQHYAHSGYQRHVNPNSFQRPFSGPAPFQGHDARKLFHPSAQVSMYPNNPPPWQQAQAAYVQVKADQEMLLVEMSESERSQKEAFLAKLQGFCEVLCKANSSLPRVTLECFGSFMSGFASAGSDMDVVIVMKESMSESTCISLDESGLPRSLEKMLLESAVGARLLDKTRVPIIQVCESPDDETLEKLRQSRKEWEDLPVEQKYPHLYKDSKKQDGEDEGTVDSIAPNKVNSKTLTTELSSSAAPERNNKTERSDNVSVSQETNANFPIPAPESFTDAISENGLASANSEKETRSQPKRDRLWTRERKKATMDFPKDGVGIQCDINFFNPLGIHNTQLLRCYSSCDPRVRPMILFVKAWAKRRKINSSYSGTLSSYGYVLMVLHYLVNVTRPAVLPNLQGPLQVGSVFFEPGRTPIQVGEWVVDFFKDEATLVEAARSGYLTRNNESLGSLLAGFFHYYAAQGGWRPDQSFFWKDSVLSLRSPSGILSKEDKGWTKLVTEEVDGKEVRHRYLFAIEDPFELKHNVARTVGHQGIVAIRDEFRRAHRILLDAGNNRPFRDGELLEYFVEPEEPSETAATQGHDATTDQHPVQITLDQPHISTHDSSTTGQPQQSNPPRQGGYTQRHYTQPVGAPTYSSKPKPRVFDVNDNNAFPAIGAKKPSVK